MWTSTRPASPCRPGRGCSSTRASSTRWSRHRKARPCSTSGVFHPRLVGGMDTIFWQKLIRPMTQPDAPPFFLLDGLVPWQKQVLDCLHESWKAVSDEPFDYENRVRYYLSLALRLLSTQCVGGRTKVSQQEQIASSG